MLKDRIMVAVQAVTQQSKWSRDLQRFTLVFAGLNGWL